MIVMDLTDREMQLLIDCIGTNIETVRRRHDPLDTMVAELLTELAELDMDLREAFNRRNDGWDAACAAAAEDTFIQAGTDAREQIKETSRAATRREQRRAQAISDGNPDASNDPVDW